MSGGKEVQIVSRHTHLDELEKSAVSEHSIKTRHHTDTSVSAGYLDRFVKAVIEMWLKLGNF